MAKAGKAKIREAILANRGGHENTSDAGIMTIWNSLDEETRGKYLDALEAHKTVEGGKGKGEKTTTDDRLSTTDDR